MSRFLHNIISRHLPGDASPETRLIVQPRPRSRFETGSSAAPAPEQSLIDDETITTATSEPASRISHTSPHHRSETGDASAAPENIVDNVQQNLNILSHAFERLAPETRIFSNRSDSHQQNITQAGSTRSEDQSTPIAERSGSNSPSSGIGLKPGSRTILHRYFTDKLAPIELPQSAELPSIADIARTGPEKSSYTPLRIEGIEQIVNNKPGIAGQREHQKAFHAGELQIPDWLTQMQHDLNNRMRDIKTVTQSEPVVNVTIGRVEVRAVHADSEKQAVARDKPVGIMSLDDYLKQRDKRQA